MAWIDVPIGGGGGGDLLDADLRGGAVSTAARLGTISNFASPNAGGVVSGRFYDNSFHSTNASTGANSNNRLDLGPYYTSVPLTIDQIGVAVSTAAASSNVRILIYSSDSSGWPDSKLLETSDIDTSTTGYKYETVDFTFSSGVQYWVGLHESGTPTIRMINISSAVNLGLTSNNATTYATIVRRTSHTYGSAPSTWSFVGADLANGSVPSIRMRAA